MMLYVPYGHMDIICFYLVVQAGGGRQEGGRGWGPVQQASKNTLLLNFSPCITLSHCEAISLVDLERAKCVQFDVSLKIM